MTDTHAKEKRDKQIGKEEGIQEILGNRYVELYCIIVYLKEWMIVTNKEL